MDSDGKSRITRQVIMFLVVFAAAFLATKYLAKAYLHAPKEKPAAVQEQPNK